MMIGHVALSSKQACKLSHQHEYLIRIYKSIYDRDSRLEVHRFHIDFELPKGRIHFYMQCFKGAVCLSWFKSFYDAIFELRDATWEGVVNLADVHTLVLSYDGDDEPSGRVPTKTIRVIPKGFDSDAVRRILSAVRY